MDRQQEQYAPRSDRLTEHDDAPVTASKTAEPQRALSGESVTINRSARELYEFWRDPANIAKLSEDVIAIEPIDDARSRWTVKAPGGKEMSWESVITHEVPGEEITWQSAEGSDIDHSGRIEFRDAGARGTVVRAIVAYAPPAGVVGQMLAKVFQREPRIQARRDLHRFKQLMETGEIATGARNRRQRDERNEEQG